MGERWGWGSPPEPRLQPGRPELGPHPPCLCPPPAGPRAGARLLLRALNQRAATGGAEGCAGLRLPGQCAQTLRGPTKKGACGLGVGPHV